MAEGQYVVFKLGQEEYGIDIMNVSEISTYQEIIKVPNVPSFIEGIINYRGSVIPIICLAKRLSIKAKEVDNNTRIIIINLQGKQIGFIVDEASSTIRISSEDIDPAPSIIGNIDTKYIKGVGKPGNRLIILVDLENILTSEEIKEVQEVNV